MKFNRLLFVSLILSTLILGTNWTYGKTWTVDDDLQDYPDADFTSIKDALNVAEDRDTILVYNGIYRDSLIFSKSISLVSKNGPNNTIIAPKVKEVAD